MTLHRLLWTALLFLAALSAQAQFTFDPQRHVYTVPEGFIPEKLSVRGLNELESTADRLHYPFYIVFYRDLPTQTGQSTEEDSERAITGLADAWASNPGFDRNRASIFLVSYGPGDRKFRLLPAPLWRSKLGLEGESLAPFLQTFKSTARRDPQTAIQRMMTQFDTSVFDRHDPQRVQELRKIAEAERMERLVTGWKTTVRLRINEADRLLKEAVPLGFTGEEPVRGLISQAQRAAQGRDTRQMQTVSTQLDSSISTLQGYVTARQEAIRAQQQRIGAIAIGSFLALVGLVAFSVSRGAQVRRLRRDLAARIATWRGWITEARQRYYVFDDNRERAIHLKGFGPETEALYRSTVKEIDDVIIGVEAVAALLDSAERKGKLGSFFSLAPLRGALKSLDEPFKFETDRINDRLFEPQNAVVEIAPGDFLRQLSDRYDQAVANWRRLNEAVDMSLHAAIELFPHRGLDQLLERAVEKGIPARWLSTHPLFGDEQSDQGVYARVESVRTTDPIAYARQISELREVEAKLSEDLTRLIEANLLADSHVIQAINDLDNTVVSPDDDPRMTLREAQQAHQRMPEAMHTAATVQDVEALAAKVNGLYDKAAEQWNAVRTAVRSVAEAYDAALGKLEDYSGEVARISDRVERAHRVHANASRANAALSNANSFRQAGENQLDKVQRRLAERRHLEAQRELHRAEELLSRAYRALADAEGICDELDADLLRYQRKAAEMEALYAQMSRRMRRYGGSLGSLGGYQRPVLGNDIYDYARLFAMLQVQEHQWNQAVYQAQAAHEAAEAARRAAESARSSSSFGGSSSSGGFSSFGGSGSSGGSFSSGGSGSSGGSW